MKVIPYDHWLQMGNLELNQAETNGAAKSIFIHHTNIDILRIIAEDKTFKLNRIDLVNDLEEKDYLGDPEVYCLVFVGCFSHKVTESIPQWYMYTKMNKGVRISLLLNEPLGLECTGLIDVNRPMVVKYADNTRENYYYGNHMFRTLYSNQKSHWSMQLSCNDIIYSNEIKKENEIIKYVNGKPWADIIPAAKIKREGWDFEEETRLVGIFRTVREGIEFEIPDHILLPIDFNKFVIEITLNPWRTDKFKKEVESICKTNLAGHSYVIHESELYKTLLKRKW